MILWLWNERGAHRIEDPRFLPTFFLHAAPAELPEIRRRTEILDGVREVREVPRRIALEDDEARPVLEIVPRHYRDIREIAHILASHGGYVGGRRGRVRHAVPRAEGRGTWRDDETRPGPGQVRGTKREIVFHVREDRLQTGPVHPARAAASGPRALRDARERFRGPRRALASFDTHATGTGAPHAGHGLHRDADEPRVPGRLPRRLEEESPGGLQGRRESLAGRSWRIHVRTGSRSARGPLRTRLFLPVSEHHGEVQHLRRDTRLRLLPHRWARRTRVAVPSVHTASRERGPRAEAANRTTPILQEDEKGTGSATRCVHGAGYDSQVDVSDLLQCRHTHPIQIEWEILHR